MSRRIGSGSHRRPRPAILVIIGIVLLIPAFAHGFAVVPPGNSPHEVITRSAVGTTMSTDALAATLGGFWTINPTGVLGSDQYQSNEGRHYDNAPSAAAICVRWAEGQWTFDQEVIAKSDPGPDALVATLRARAEALDSLGAAFHAVQDFYAHSNWVEYNLERGVIPPPAPFVSGTTCQPADVPLGVQTGYYEWRASRPFVNGGPFWACPPTGPPPEYRYCHADLNKDKPTSPEGRRMARALWPPSSTAAAPPGTLYSLAADVATTATRDHLPLLGALMASRYTPENSNSTGVCLFRKLIGAWDGPCIDLTGAWYLDIPGSTTGLTLNPSAGGVTANINVPTPCPGSTVPVSPWVTARYDGSALRGTLISCIVNENDPSQPAGPACHARFPEYQVETQFYAPLRGADPYLYLTSHWPGFDEVNGVCSVNPARGFDFTEAIHRPRAVSTLSPVLGFGMIPRPLSTRRVGRSHLVACPLVESHDARPQMRGEHRRRASLSFGRTR